MNNDANDCNASSIHVLVILFFCDSCVLEKKLV
jgi:hypothetical protein